MKEIISIHVGQCGVQLGNSCWELFCLEHGIQPDGQISQNTSDNSFQTFFNETESGKFSPRAIYVDLDPRQIDKVRTGIYKELFSPDQLISGNEDSSYLFPRGYRIFGLTIIESIMKQVRKTVESCDNLQGFIFYNAVGGGTGSGLTSRILDEFDNQYDKEIKLAFSVYPSPRISTVIVEPYNAVLSTFSLKDQTDLVVVIDNDAVYNICSRQLNIEMPSYTNMNRLISQVISNITASFRFDVALNSDISEFKSNLIPKQNMNFLLSSLAPIIQADNASHEQIDVDYITNCAFQTENMMAQCNPEQGKYMACCLMYRGQVVLNEALQAAAEIKNKITLQFADWCPTGFKCGINYQPTTVAPGSEFARLDKTACMISNNTSIFEVFQKFLTCYDKMYAKQAFLYWFVFEALKEGELVQGREELAFLQKDYEIVSGNYSDDDSD